MLRHYRDTCLVEMKRNSSYILSHVGETGGWGKKRGGGEDGRKQSLYIAYFILWCNYTAHIDII